MYIHLMPVFMDDLFLGEPKLISVEIPELNFCLKNDELTQSKPYNNKKYIVGSNKKAKKIGILIKTNQNIDKFTSIYTWVISGITFKHTIHNIIEDHEQELFSQYFTLNLAHQTEHDNFSNRLYKDYANIKPVYLDAVFRNDIQKFLSIDDIRAPLDHVIDICVLQEEDEELGIFEDSFTYVSEIFDELHLHSLENERLSKLNYFKKHNPDLSDAIIID